MLAATALYFPLRRGSGPLAELLPTGGASPLQGIQRGAWPLASVSAAVSTCGRAGSMAALVTTSEPSAEMILPSALSPPSLIASFTWQGPG